MNTQQKVFIVFIFGISITGTSIVFINSEYGILMLMVGVWFVIFSGVLFKMYGAQTSTPKVDMARKEQFLSNIKLLLT